MNFFQTHKHTHEIPNDVLKRAIVLSPKGDWTDPDTDAYQFLKKWALNEDDRRDGKPAEKPRVKQLDIDKIKDDLANNVTQRWEGKSIPLSVINEAMALSPEKSISDKRTKAYKFLKAWALNEDNRRDGTNKDDFKGVVSADGVKAEDMQSVYFFEGVEIPDKIMQHAQMMALQSGKPYQDKRTKAYKYLKNWIKNNEES